MEGNESKGGRTQGGQRAEQNENVREGFGDDMGTRVGRPDAGGADDRSMARLSENADDRGLEGAALDGAGQGGRSSTRADGSSMEGDTLDHSQRAQSGMGKEGSKSGSQGGATGAGGEANRGVEGANVRGGTDEQGGSQGESRSGAGTSGAGAGVNQGDRGQGDRAGSEPLAGRKDEHKGSYGGEGGEPRSSSDQREKGLDYYGDEGTGKSR